MHLFQLHHLDQLSQLPQLETQLFPQDNWDSPALTELFNQPYNHFFGLYINKVLAGYAIVQVMFDTAEILRIGVATDYQGRGFGKQLLQAILDFLAKTPAEKLLLEVRQDNLPAIRLYQHMGFSQIHVRKNYYQRLDGTFCDALILQKILEPVFIPCLP